MEFKFFDSICFTGVKTIPVKNIDYSESAVKNMLLSVNVKKAFCCPNFLYESGTLSFNKDAFDKLRNDDFFLPGFNLIINPGEFFWGPSYVENFIKENHPGIIYMFPEFHGYSMSLGNVSDYFDIISKEAVPIRIPAAGITQSELEEICKVYKNIPLIIANTGYSIKINIPYMMKKYDNIYIDTSFYPAGSLEYICGHFGSERIVFSSCAPELSPTAPAGRIIMADLKDEEKENIAYKNLERLSRTGVKPYMP